MADYDKRYRLDSIAERNDGSEMVAHDLWAEASVEGENNWTPIPARHKTVLVPGADLSAAMALGTNGAKVAAYKNLLVANLNTQAVAVTGWDLASLEALLDANDVAAEAAAAAVEFITVTLGLSFPVPFTL